LNAHLRQNLTVAELQYGWPVVAKMAEAVDFGCQQRDSNIASRYTELKALVKSSFAMMESEERMLEKRRVACTAASQPPEIPTPN
jgi:hypothetical protein